MQLSETPQLENRPNDFINFLHNGIEQYYKKTDEAQFFKRFVIPRKPQKLRGFYVSLVALAIFSFLEQF